VNDELISQSITDLFRLDYKILFNLKHKNKLQKLKSKLELEKLDDKKKQKLIKSLEKSKEKYFKLSKLEITKKEIEYLVEEIKKILENL
jgi:Cys-tRNA synthase (O-phospho-L-seryl-tRNA:Cys-tRNA synthase)